MQIMEVLKRVGASHFSLSSGLVCGGHDFETERAAVGHMNILVATPGRLLQHLEQSPELDPSALEVLVLDEADRLLDMGFSSTLSSILAVLPTHPQRQTLLFSATSTKSVTALARLSLHAPEYVAVHEQSVAATPHKLSQHYVVVKLEDKLNVLYSFIKTHLRAKTIVFLSSCKQVRFVFEIFRRIRPGIPLLHLHGKQKQVRRMHIYYEFVSFFCCYYC
jgi:ATP-dependent RNA helicase DDX10/DBP4